jgi:hypothetical protein
MRFSCTCGESIFVPSAYCPEPGDTDPAPWICPRCRKEWEIYPGHKKMEVREKVDE